MNRKIIECEFLLHDQEERKVNILLLIFRDKDLFHSKFYVMPLINQDTPQKYLDCFQIVSPDRNSRG